ncbi:MAG: type IV pilin N-terminal domain-containing protein [Methanomicrobiales archaeon]|nr:type IV pilin N-terminal domain-containing protein [Methanomicrobiales archaeon]
MVKTDDQDKGVSPVIGVILMLAITVILASVMAAFAIGFTGAIQRPYDVHASAYQEGGNIVVTYRGGQDHEAVEAIRITIVDSRGVTLEPNHELPSPSIGESHSEAGATAGRDHVVVVARFKDNSERVILDAYV